METVSKLMEDSFMSNVQSKQGSALIKSNVREKGRKGNHNKRKGTSFEYRIADKYRRAGYIVLRARGSLGPADLIALKAGERDVFIQCKDYKSTYFDRNEMSNFISFCTAHNKRCIWAYSYHSSPEKRGKTRFLDLEKIAIKDITKDIYAVGNCSLT